PSNWSIWATDRASRLLKNSLRFRKKVGRRKIFGLGLVDCGKWASTVNHFPFHFHGAGHTSPVGARSLGRRTMSYAAMAKAKAARTLARPRTLTCARPPTVLLQPKHSSIRL